MLVAELIAHLAQYPENAEVRVSDELLELESLQLLDGPDPFVVLDLARPQETWRSRAVSPEIGQRRDRVAELHAEGLTGVQIAEKLGISVDVANRDKRKLGLGRRPKVNVTPAHARAPVLPPAPDGFFTPESKPRYARRTHRELFNDFVIVEGDRWDGAASDFPPSMIAGIADSPEELAQWVSQLKQAHQRLGAYINEIERKAQSQ